MKIVTKIVKEESYDPYFKVCFSYEDKGVVIERGCAEIIRKAPRIEIKYDVDTEARLGEVDRYKLELELINSVVNHIFSSRTGRYAGIF